MDFLRLITDDLQALKNEIKKKYPVVKEAIEKALESVQQLQKDYAALLRVESAPGPGHPLFKCESVLQPFLLACNHTNASNKLIVLSLSSIQRLVSWDAIKQSSVGSILRVLQMQAEKNNHVEVQVKLLQTLLQLCTLSFEGKHNTKTENVGTNSTNAEAPMVNSTHCQEGEASVSTEEGSALIGNEDLVMQAIWICVHLHGGSSGASSVVGNTAAMTIRQLVSLAFSHVKKTPQTKRVGVLVFQELAFMTREENGVWLKRSATSSMSVALGVELLESILGTHFSLFREDAEFTAVLKQHIVSLIQSALETGCIEKQSGSGTSLTVGSSISTSHFPVLVRIMRLASIFLCNFSNLLQDESATVIKCLLDVVSTGAYHIQTNIKSPSHAKVSSSEMKHFHHGSSNSIGSSGAAVNYVTWPVLLALEVINRLSVEADMIGAFISHPDSILVQINRTISSVITTSPPVDFKLHGAESSSSSTSSNTSAPNVPLRSGMEYLNEQESPPLQQFFSAIRVANTCQNNFLTSIFDIAKSTTDRHFSESMAKFTVTPISPFLMHSLNTMLRHCREVDLITMSLKSYHLLATTTIRLRTSLENQKMLECSKRLDEIEIYCLRALCAFSFPLPDSVKSVHPNTSGSNSTSTRTPTSTSGLDHHDDFEDNDTAATVVFTWREVQAMKAVLAAVHVMEEELKETEWIILLKAFEIIVGLTDPRVKSGHCKLPTKTYRINAFRVEDEDVEQQLTMLGISVMEFFQEAPKLPSFALFNMLAALRRVCWEELGLAHPNERAEASATGEISGAPPGWELPMLPCVHQMKMYLNYLGVGLTGTTTFSPCFSLRMLIQMASINKRSFDETVTELLLFSTHTSSPVPPQINHFQTYTTDHLIQLLQYQMQRSASLDKQKESFDQQELLQPLLRLMHSDMKDRTLYGILEMLNSSGHLICSGWPVVLSSIQVAAETGDSKVQIAAFKCLRLIVDDLLVSIPREYMENCIHCIGRFACHAKDVNISLTAVNELWSVADIIGKQKGIAKSETNQTPTPLACMSLWGCAFGELRRVALDERTEVRNCAVNTLFGTAVTYGIQFDLNEWQLFLDETVLPLAVKLYQGRSSILTNESRSPLKSVPGSPHGGASQNIVMHHSRDNADKQWDETRVLLLTGMSRVLQTNSHYLLQHSNWFSSIWKQILRQVSLNTERCMSKEVVLAAINTLQTLLQVSSSCDFEQFTTSQPVRAGAGMRVIGGALVASAHSTPISKKNLTSGTFLRDPGLWNEAFDLLLRLCDERFRIDSSNPSHIPWKEDDEQEIASAVVAVLIALYTQSKEHEFKDENNVVRLLDILEILLMRHVLDTKHEHKGVSNITTNSLQSRVLNAFEECGSFSSHPGVHTKIIDQLIKYISLSSYQELVFFTRHALISLAKLYAGITSESRAQRFIEVQKCIEKFLIVNHHKEEQLTAVQKASGQLWKHALRVLLVLISHGLASVKLDEACWRPLLDLIIKFLFSATSDGTTGESVHSQVLSEEDEGLLLSVLECLVDSVLAMLSNETVKSSEVPQYEAFCEKLIEVFCSGVETFHEKRKQFMKCCVRQLSTLSVQIQDKNLSKLARKKLVHYCSVTLIHFAEVENVSSSGNKSKDFLETKERVLILLGTTAEVGMSPRSILELFPALCTCITSADLDVRKLIQRMLMNGKLTEYCIQLLDIHEKKSATQTEE
jgi:hypothetical protein